MVCLLEQEGFARVAAHGDIRDAGSTFLLLTGFPIRMGGRVGFVCSQFGGGRVPGD